MRIEAVLFDMDNTLIDWFAAQESYCSVFAERHMAFLSRKERAEAAAQIMEWMGDGNVIPLDTWFAMVLKQWPIAATQRTLEEERIDLFPSFTVPMPGMMETLAVLKKRYRLGLLTNGGPATQRKKVAAAGIESFFDCIVVSGETPWHKPDPRIFHDILGRMGIGPEHAVYVGDHVQNDVHGALGVGMRPIRLRLAGHPYASVEGVPEVDALGELADILSQMEEKEG